MEPVVQKFAGPSNSGKTTMISNLVEELAKRGYRIGVIKHDPANHWEWDHPGTDTERHARAGADGVAVLSPGRFGLYQKREGELPVRELVRRFDPIPNLVLLEGFKGSDWPGFEYREGGWVNGSGRRFEEGDVSGLLQHLEDRLERETEPEFDCRLYVGGEEVPLKSYPRSVLRELLKGYCRTLHDVSSDRALRVEIEPPDTG